MLKGAYTFIEDADAQVTLIGVGAEMVFAVQARDVLREKHGIKARVVSFPCQRLFEKQPWDYKASVLGYRKGTPRVAIEAYAANGWERYAEAGYTMSTERFGHSLPGPAAYKYFGYDPEVIAGAVDGFVKEWQEKGGYEAFRGEFRDLNTTRHEH